MYKQAEKPNIQLLLLFCATPAVIISLFILIAFYISLWQPNNELTGDLTQLISATIFSAASIILLASEYYSIMRGSEKGALTASILCMAATNLSILLLMGKATELLGIVQMSESSHAGVSLSFIILFFVASTIISFGHVRWYFKIEKYTTKPSLYKDEIEYIRFGKRLLAFLIDIAVFFLFTYIISIRNMINAVEEKIFLPLILQNFIFTAVTIFFVVKFGGTPGKLILGIRIVDKNRKFITIGAAILRIILYLPNFLIYLLKMHYVYANMPPTESLQTQHEFYEAIKLYGGIYSSQVITIALFLIPIADAMFILFTDKKRAAHDFLAGSYVVSKGSCSKTEVKNQVRY